MELHFIVGKHPVSQHYRNIFIPSKPICKKLAFEMIWSPWSIFFFQLNILFKMKRVRQKVSKVTYKMKKTKEKKKQLKLYQHDYTNVTTNQVFTDVIIVNNDFR